MNVDYNLCLIGVYFDPTTTLFWMSVLPIESCDTAPASAKRGTMTHDRSRWRLGSWGKAVQMIHTCAACMLQCTVVLPRMRKKGRERGSDRRDGVHERDWTKDMSKPLHEGPMGRY